MNRMNLTMLRVECFRLQSFYSMYSMILVSTVRALWRTGLSSLQFRGSRASAGFRGCSRAVNLDKEAKNKNHVTCSKSTSQTKCC
jgi:hypothetical protein